MSPSTSSNADLVKPNVRTVKILKSLRDARKIAPHPARLHRVPFIYMKNGKLIRVRP